MTLRAGRLREKLDLQVVAGVSDGAGGTVNTWSTLIPQIRAEVLPVTGGEAFRQGMLNATQMYRITIRYRDGITPRHRLMWKGQALNIRTCADPTNKREELLIMAESGAAEP